MVLNTPLISLFTLHHYVVETNCWDVLITSSWDVVPTFQYDVTETYYWDVLETFHREVFGLFNLKRTCDVTGTHREMSLRLRQDTFLPGGFFSFFLIYLFHSQKSYKTLKYLYTYTMAHRHTHIHAYAYMCGYTVYAYAPVHICIIVYISTAIIRENRTCRRLRVLSSSPENILK